MFVKHSGLPTKIFSDTSNRHDGDPGAIDVVGTQPTLHPIETKDSVQQEEIDGE